MIEVNFYRRKTFFVTAVQVTEENMKDVADWCAGKVVHTASDKKFIKVDVKRALSPRQKQAFVGDWVLSNGKGFKVYTKSAFERNFELDEDEVRDGLVSVTVGVVPPQVASSE